MTSAPPTRDGVVVSTLCTSEDVTDHGTLCNLLQEGTQDHRVWETLYTTSPAAPQYLQYTAIWEYAMEHCTVSHLTSQVLTDLDTVRDLLMEVP